MAKALWLVALRGPLSATAHKPATRPRWPARDAGIDFENASPLARLGDRRQDSLREALAVAAMIRGSQQPSRSTASLDSGDRSGTELYAAAMRQVEIIEEAGSRQEV